MSYNPYTMPPPHFGNIPGQFCPPGPPPPNIYQPRFNVDFSRPPPPMMAPVIPPPAPVMIPTNSNFHQGYQSHGFAPPRLPPMPQALPYGTDMYRSMLPPPQHVPLSQRAKQFPPRPPPGVPDFRCHQMRVNFPTNSSVPVARWNGPRPVNGSRPVRTPMVERTQAGNVGEGATPWPLKRQHSDQGEASTMQVKKKVKVNKRELPENNAFYCDCCDRGFKTSDKLEEHVDQHEKCQVAGCKYVAAPKLVQLHYQFQHRTGLAKKIWLPSTKDENEKWILERKRNWPTAENKERKRKEAADRRSRGDVLDNRYFGQMRGGRSGHGPGRGWYSAFNDRNSCDESKPIDQSASAFVDGVKTELHGSATVIHSKSSVVGQEDVHSSNVAFSIEPINRDKTVNSSMFRPIYNKETQEQSKPVARQRKKPFKKRTSTLLEKLLAPEIRHERNVILQCVKYVVQHYNLRQSLAAKTVRQKSSSGSCSAASSGVSSDTIDCDVSVDSAAAEQTLMSVVEDVLGTSKTRGEIDARYVDSSESSVAVTASDSTIKSADAVTGAMGHVDVTDGDSGIGSPLRNVPSSQSDE